MNVAPRATGESVLARLKDLAGVLKDIVERPIPGPDVDGAPAFSSKEALLAVIEFLDGYQQFRGEGPGVGLTRPLWDLLIALSDLDHGVTHPMLRVCQNAPRGSSTHYQAVKAWSAITLDILISTGTPDKEAQQTVANELAGIRMSAGAHRTHVTPSTVETWRADLSRNKGSRQAQVTWDHYCRQKSGATADHDRLRQWAIEHLRTFVTESRFQISP